jgi:hypothetical protein
MGIVVGTLRRSIELLADKHPPSSFFAQWSEVALNPPFTRDDDRGWLRGAP